MGNRNESTRGQSLIAVLISAAIMAILITSFLSFFRTQSNASRQIASWGAISDLSKGLDMLFSTPQCASTGNFLSGGSNASVTVSGTAYSLALDTLQFANNAIAVTSLPNVAWGTRLAPYTVSSITMTPAGGSGPFGSGFAYPFIMDITFASSAGPPPRPLTKYVTVYANAAQNVVGACYSAGASGMTIGGWYVTASTYCPHINNPMTGAMSCPPGFTPKPALVALCNASDASARIFFLCIR